MRILKFLHRIFPVVAAIIAVHDFYIDACWTTAVPPSMPEIISATIQVKIDNGIAYSTEQPLWSSNPAANSSLPILVDFANSTLLNLWDFVDITRPIASRLEQVVNTINDHMCRNDDGEDMVIAYSCSQVQHAVAVFDSLDLAQRIHTTDGDDEDWQAFVSNMLAISPLETTNVTVATTLFVANRLSNLEVLIQPYQDLSGAMKYIRDATLEAIIGKADMEDVVDATQYIADQYFSRLATAPSLHFFDEGRESYFRNAIIDALEQHEEEALTEELEQARWRMSTAGARVFRNKRRAFRRRPRPPNPPRPNGKPRKPTTMGQDAARATRVNNRHRVSWEQADQYFENYWARKRSRTSIRQSSDKITAVKQQASASATTNLNGIASGKQN